MPVLFVLFSVVATAGLALAVLRHRGGRVTWAGDPTEHFVGSGTWCRRGGAARASWPLVRLDIAPAGIVVGPTSRWLRWAVPRVEMRWADITCVERCPTGVRINLSDASDRSLLFQLHRDDVLAALRPYPIEVRAS